MISSSGKNVTDVFANMLNDVNAGNANLITYDKILANAKELNVSRPTLDKLIKEHESKNKEQG